MRLNKVITFNSGGGDGVASFAVELEGIELYAFPLGTVRFRDNRVVSWVSFSSNLWSGLRCGVDNQLDDHFVADEWPASPVLSDRAEFLMLDPVPLADARRKMTDTNGYL